MIKKNPEAVLYSRASQSKDHRPMSSGQSYLSANGPGLINQGSVFRRMPKRMQSPISTATSVVTSIGMFPKSLPTCEDVETSNERFEFLVEKPGQRRTSIEIELADGGSMQYLHYRPLDRTDGTLLHNQRRMVTHTYDCVPQPQKEGMEPTPVAIIAFESEFRFRTGQGWLDAAAKLIYEYVFSNAGYAMPNIVTTIGFPSRQAVSPVRRTGGQCWASSISENGVNFICISPLIKTDVERLDILAHEMVHAVDDLKSGHRGNFVEICKAVGLTEGKPSSASAGAALMHVIEQISRELGPCPFTALNYTPRVRKAPPPTHKLECPQCQFTCRTSDGNVELGLPTCACGTKLVDLSADFPVLG